MHLQQTPPLVDHLEQSLLLNSVFLGVTMLPPFLFVLSFLIAIFGLCVDKSKTAICSHIFSCSPVLHDRMFSCPHAFQALSLLHVLPGGSPFFNTSAASLGTAQRAWCVTGELSQPDSIRCSRWRPRHIFILYYCGGRREQIRRALPRPIHYSLLPLFYACRACGDA